MARFAVSWRVYDSSAYRCPEKPSYVSISVARLDSFRASDGENMYLGEPDVDQSDLRRRCNYSNLLVGRRGIWISLSDRAQCFRAR